MENPKAAFYTALFPELIFLKSRCGVYLGGFFSCFCLGRMDLCLFFNTAKRLLS